MEKYPFYDIVLFIVILSNVLFMSIAIITSLQLYK